MSESIMHMMQYTLVILVGGNLPEVHDAVKVPGD